MITIWKSKKTLIVQKTIEKFSASNIFWIINIPIDH